MTRIQLRKRSRKRVLNERPDDELLSSLRIGHDQTAFTALVERYEQMVLSVCLRVLRHRQDAEDSCQSTFFILWRKAGLIRDGWKLKSWLHGAAHHEALNVRKKKRRREEHESPSGVCDLVHLVRSADETSFREFQALLKVTVQDLPEKYCAPITLCCLEGKSKAEAAAELGWPEGTVSCRLVRGRELLRRRLERSGIAYPNELTRSR